MKDVEAIELTEIIGNSGNYQRTSFFWSFYSSWFVGSAVVIMDLCAPMVTMYWKWDDFSGNTTSFFSNDCDMGVIMDLNRTSNFSNMNSKLIYESPYSSSTLTEKFDLVCEQSWHVSLANFLSLIGNAFGNILQYSSEKFGRRPMIVLSAVVSVVLSLCMLFPVGFIMFTTAFCLFRGCVFQLAILIFIQTVEISNSSTRPFVGIILKSGVLFGQSVFVCAAWILKDWFYTLLVHTVLVALLMPTWFMLESPIWLAVRGRYDKARDVLVQIVKRNRRNLQEIEPKIDTWLLQMKVRCETNNQAEKGQIRDLFKNRRITLYTCGITLTVFSGTFIYNALVFNTESFGSGLFVDLMASNGFGLLAVLIIATLLRITSVRLILCMSFLLEGISCLVYPVSYGYPLARTIVSVLGRIFISPVFAVYNVYLNEIFPTSVRGVGSGFTSFLSFILASPASFTKELGEKSSVYVPFILFAILSLSSALVYKLLPETKGRPIVHTVNELEDFSRGADNTNRKL